MWTLFTCSLLALKLRLSYYLLKEYFASHNVDVLTLNMHSDILKTAANFMPVMNLIFLKHQFF